MYNCEIKKKTNIKRNEGQIGQKPSYYEKV